MIMVMIIIAIMNTTITNMGNETVREDDMMDIITTNSMRSMHEA